MTAATLGRHMLPGAAQSAGESRRIVAKCLHGWPPDLVDDAQLLVSELFANAFLHSRSADDGHVQLTVIQLAEREQVRVEVTDQGSPGTVPAAHHAVPLADGGRGLNLVELLAADWGFSQCCDHSTTVWFELKAS